MPQKTKKAEIIDARAKLLLLIENVKDYAFIILDPKGKVDDWNKGAEYLLRYNEKEIIGKNFSRFFTPEDKKAKRPERELQEAQVIGQSNDENWLVRKDKSRFWASGMTVPIYDKVGNLIGFAKIVRDLTEKRELDQQQQDFITIATHELRTPFTVAKLLRQVLRKHLLQQNDKKGLIYFDKTSQAMDQIDNLLKDLLNMSKIQTGKVDYEKEAFVMGDIVKNVIDELQETTKHTILLKNTSKKKLFANKAQIIEVITNLLTNAMKYSSEEKKILVTVTATQKYVKVSVQDFGIGIPKKQIAYLFNRFYRTPLSKEKNIPGIGLGLYISKKIIENHRGTFEVTSTLKKGSTFTFILPFLQQL